MLLTTLPFDYATLLDPGDRLRTSRRKASGVRIRRTAARDKG
jgi:hypothetical protein